MRKGFGTEVDGVVSIFRRGISRTDNRQRTMHEIAPESTITIMFLSLALLSEKGDYISTCIIMTVFWCLQMHIIMWNEIKHSTSPSPFTLCTSRRTFPLKHKSCNPSYSTIQLHNHFPENRIPSPTIRHDPSG